MAIKKAICHTAFSLISYMTYSQHGNMVSGRITDDRSAPIASASVHVLNTADVTISDSAGRFVISKIHKGNYLLEISAVGYSTFVIPLQVADGRNRLPDTHLADEVRQLDEIVVNAQKREERIQSVPIAISSFSAKDIDAYRLWSDNDLTAVVSNLYAGNPGDGRNVIAVRGITSSSYDPAVATYIDGVSQFTLDNYIPQLFDVERIEVLKGPQGTLYGRNALGGVINIITKKPSDKTTVSVELGTGNDGLQRYTASLCLPLIKNKLSFGAAGLYEGMNGFYTNDFNHTHFDKQHRFAGNYYLRYLVDPGWVVTLNLKHLSNRNDGAFPLTASLADAMSKPFHVNQNAVGEMIDNTVNTSLSVEYTGPAFNFTAQTAYQSNYRYYASPLDGDFSPIDGITIINNYGPKWNNVSVLTQEFKFTSLPQSLSSWKWTAGAYFFSQYVPNKQATHFGKDAQYVGSTDTDYAIINTTTARNQGASIYGQVHYTLGKATTITGGLRFDYQHSQERVLGQYQQDNAPAPSFLTQPDTTAKANNTALSPMLSVDERITDNTNIYLSYNRGYRTGGLTQLSSDPTQPPLYAYQPEYSNDFETGMKNSFLHKRLIADLAFFYTEVDHAQVPTLLLPEAITVTKNAGRLSSKGLDADITAIPVQELEVAYSFGYTHSVYQTLKLSENGNAVDLSGNHQVFTPDITSMLAVQYGLPVNKQHTTKIVLRGEWFYLGKEFFDLANSIRQSSYQRLNTRFGIIFKQVELWCWGRNLTNTRYISYAYDFGAVHLGDPKTYGITAKIKL